MTPSLLRRAFAPLIAFPLLLASCGGKEGGAPEWAGRWSGATAQGTSVITLEERGDAVVMIVNGDEAEGRRTAAGRVEGEKRTPEGTLAFVLERRGAQLAARFTLTLPDGQSEQSPEVLYTREAAAGAQAGGGAGGVGERPTHLVGHWRHTETFAREGLSMATDTHMVLEADGTSRSWRRTEGAISSSDPEESGRWKVEGKDLLIQLEGESDWRTLGRFAADGDRLMLTYANGNKQVFERL